MQRWARRGPVGAIVLLAGTAGMMPMAHANPSLNGSSATPESSAVLVPDVLKCIVSQLPPLDQLSASMVCTQLNEAAQPSLQAVKVVRTQAQLNAALTNPDVLTVVVVAQEPLAIRTEPANTLASVVVHDTKTAQDRKEVRVKVDIHVTASGTACVRLYGKAQATASDKAVIYAYASAQITASGEASVYATCSTRVTAGGSSKIYGYDSAHINATGSARVYAYDAAQVSATRSVTVEVFSNCVQVTRCDSLLNFGCTLF